MIDRIVDILSPSEGRIAKVGEDGLRGLRKDRRRRRYFFRFLALRRLRRTAGWAPAEAGAGVEAGVEGALADWLTCNRL